MHTITYTITTLAPVVIASRFGDMNLINTKPYIPGTSVLGLLAHRVLDHKRLSSAQALTDEHFYRWFLCGDLKIGNAYIVSYDEYENKRVHFPTPLSIHHEKHNDKIIYDLLYADDGFDKQTKYVKNFCAIEDGILSTNSITTELNFHHARERETGISKEGMIFTYEAIAKEQIFQGMIAGEKDDLDKLIKFFQSETPGGIAYIGRSKNAQYGRIKITFSDLREQTQNAIQPQQEVSLTLLSDTIIYTEYGFPTTDPQALLNQYLPHAKLRNAMIKMTSVENFMGVWRMKTPSTTCFAAGSTFLLDTSQCDATDLAKLEKTGIGERTHEGFGQCTFAWQTAGIQAEEKDDPEDLFPPKFPMPATVKEILQAVVRNTFEKYTELMALNDLEGFKSIKRLPTSASFISRLQAIAKSSDSQHVFAQKLTELSKRKPARDKLEACHNEKKTLLAFLSEQPSQVATVLQQSTNAQLKKLCHDIEYDAETDDNLENALFHIYFDTFFAMMRKYVAKGGK